MSRYNIGVDVGGTTVKIGLFDTGKPANEFVMKRAIPTRTENDGVHILPDIAEAIAVMLEECGASTDDVDKIGVGVPGPVVKDRETGHLLVNKCVNLGWSMLVDVSAELEELTGVHDISVTNDANAAALGEVIGGSCRDKSVVVITIGTGIGGGIVQSGEILEGAFGAAGEVGHMKVEPQHPFLMSLVRTVPSAECSIERGASGGSDEEVLNCSKPVDRKERARYAVGLEPFADLEYYTSAVGIARVANAALEILPDESEMRDADVVDAKLVMDAAKAGDALALKVTDFFFDTLGHGLATIASVVDPDMFIIGGGVAGAGPFLTLGLQAAYKKYVFHASSETEFRLAVLGNDAGMIGAACCGD